MPRQRPDRIVDRSRGTVRIVIPTKLGMRRTNGVPKLLDELIDERTPVEIVDAQPRADYWITRAALSAEVERQAAQRSAMPVVLPEGGRWLRERIDRAVLDGADVVLWMGSSE